MTDDEADMYYDRWLNAKNTIKRLEAGIMDMKQTIANKEIEIERLGANVEQMQKDLDLVYEHDSNLLDHLRGWK